MDSGESRWEDSGAGLRPSYPPDLLSHPVWGLGHKPHSRGKPWLGVLAYCLWNQGDWS